MADSWLKYMAVKSNSVQDDVDPGLGIQSHPPAPKKNRRNSRDFANKFNLI
jgi:hypothetical protein